MVTHFFEQFLCALVGSITGLLLTVRFVVIPFLGKYMGSKLAELHKEDIEQKTGILLLEHKLAIVTGSPVFRRLDHLFPDRPKPTVN